MKVIINLLNNSLILLGLTLNLKNIYLCLADHHYLQYAAINTFPIQIAIKNAFSFNRSNVLIVK